MTVEGELLRTYDDLIEFLSERLTDEDARRDWAGPPPARAPSTPSCAGCGRASTAAPIVRGDLPAGRRVVTTEGQQVTVIDLHNLPERAQRFVVGVVLAAETARKEARGRPAGCCSRAGRAEQVRPAGGQPPIKEVLLDIAERGRSLGIILIGAQQTASEVERRIVSNSSVKVVGRLDPAEAGRPEYGFLPPSQRARAVLAKPGTMFVSQPEIPVPLAVEFPFPAWATRPGEFAAPVLTGPVRLGRCRTTSCSTSEDDRCDCSTPATGTSARCSRPSPPRRAARRAGRDRHVVREQAVDLVLVAGDVFESAAPSADAQQVAFDDAAGHARHRCSGGGRRRQPRLGRGVRGVAAVFAAAGICCRAASTRRTTAACPSTASPAPVSG